MKDTIEFYDKEIAKLKEKIDSIDNSIEKYEREKKKSSSDIIYWSYVGEIEKLAKEKIKLNKEIHYYSLKSALLDIINNEDDIHMEIYRQISRILDEHKELTDRK